MIIDTQEQYDEIPDGTVMSLVQTGDGWDEEKGKSFKVVKIGGRLREVLEGGWDFNDRDDIGKDYYDDYSFILIK